MGTLVTFQPAVQSSRPALPAADRGKLLLFTGIRYERSGENDRPDGSSQGARKTPRRRG